MKHHLLYCIDALVDRYELTEPFLDAGCGCGDVSLHFARRGWRGRAVDSSRDAVDGARKLLRDYPAVEVAEERVDEVTGSFSTLLMLDVLEHVKDDTDLLAAAARLVRPGGHLLLAVPSNPREWRWDDELYGHVRRYREADLRLALKRAGFTLRVCWDFTFPVFWMMRRVYTWIKSPPRIEGLREVRTASSSAVDAWRLPVISALLSRDWAFWRVVSHTQFRLFRRAVGWGHELLMLAERETSCGRVLRGAPE